MSPFWFFVYILNNFKLVSYLNILISFMPVLFHIFFFIYVILWFITLKILNSHFKSLSDSSVVYLSRVDTSSTGWICRLFFQTSFLWMSWDFCWWLILNTRLYKLVLFSPLSLFLSPDSFPSHSFTVTTDSQPIIIYNSLGVPVP